MNDRWKFTLGSTEDRYRIDNLQRIDQGLTKDL
jgi:hypothetical protein